MDEKMLSINEAIQECIIRQENKANMDDVVENVIGNRTEQPKLQANGTEG